MMEFFELGYPNISPTVTTLNLSNPDLPGPRGEEIDSGKNLAQGNPMGWPLTPEMSRLGLGSKNTVLIFLMKARSRAQLVMAVPSLIDFCRTAEDG